MAKKKTKDTKGLAGIVKNVPRELDIKGQKHMLAWITPKEGETLKALGGAGILGPMGIPAFPPGGRSGGDTGGKGRGGSRGGDDDPQGDNVDRSDAGDDFDDSPSDDAGKIGSDDDENEDQDVQQDIAMRDYLDDKENRNWVENRMLDSLKKANLEQYTGLDPKGLNQYGLSEYASKFSPFQSGKAKITVDQDGVITSYEQPNPGVEYDPIRDAYTGYREDVNLPGVLGLVTEMLGVQPNVYTGFGKGMTSNRFSDDKDDRDERPSGLRYLQTGKEEDITPVSVSPADYYGKGIGSATIDMSDPLQRERFLMNLYGYTPSPIGATFDQPTSSYTIPGGSKKSRTRLRGLDIFKPVTV